LLAQPTQIVQFLRDCYFRILPDHDVAATNAATEAASSEAWRMMCHVKIVSRISRSSVTSNPSGKSTACSHGRTLSTGCLLSVHTVQTGRQKPLRAIRNVDPSQNSSLPPPLKFGCKSATRALDRASTTSVPLRKKPVRRNSHCP